MEVKGTAVATTPDFIRNRFGPEAYARWLVALAPASRAVFEGKVLVSGWYPLRQAFSLPTRVLCDLFFDGSARGAWEVGRFSADVGLRGIYKVFIKIGSPAWSIDRAGKAFSSYYRPSAIEVFDRDKYSLRFKVTELVDPEGMVEQRIAGWCERALEIIGVNAPAIELERSLAAGDTAIQFRATWS